MKKIMLELSVGEAVEILENRVRELERHLKQEIYNNEGKFFSDKQYELSEKINEYQDQLFELKLK